MKGKKENNPDMDTGTWNSNASNELQLTGKIGTRSSLSSLNPCC